MTVWYEASLSGLNAEQCEQALQMLSDHFGISGVETELPDGSRQISWYGEDKVQMHLVATQLLGVTNTPSFSLHAVNEQAWQEAWLERPQSFITDRFQVILDEDPVNVLPNKIPLVITAGRAFGNGQHATTLACLKMLEREFSGGSVLDLGTGTGILAIAAAKLGADRIVGTEIDDELTAIACHNATRNHIAGTWITRAEPDLAWDHFDLIVSNVLIPALFDLIPACRQLIARDGKLMLAGFIERDLPDVEAVLGRQGFHLTQKSLERGWLATLWSLPAS